MKKTFYYLTLRQFINHLAWLAKGRKIPLPHLYKLKVIRECQDKINAEILVETGTYLGETVNALKSQFAKIFSIELDHELCPFEIFKEPI